MVLRKKLFSVEVSRRNVLSSECCFNRREALRIINLGADSVSSVKKIAAILFEEMGLRDVKIRVAGGLRSWPGDQPRVYMTVDKMKTFGWKAKLHSDEAVRTAARRMLGKA
jgi:UDP-glucose 4-epimerase